MKDVSQRIADHLKKGVTIIIESTLALGKTDNIVQPILEERSSLNRGEDFYLVWSFESVMPGKLIEYIIEFPRVIGGGCPKANERAKFLYSKVIKKKLQVTDTLTAELTDDFDEAFSKADVLIFATNHNEYYKINLNDLRKILRTSIIIEGRNISNKKQVEEKGYQ